MIAPGIRTVQGFFEGRPGALHLFNVIEGLIRTFGPVRTEVMKTQISFGAERKFAWVWLPQTWIMKRPEDSITLTFALRRRIEDERIEEAVEPRPGIWTHHVVIEKEADIDDKVLPWLKEAYSFGQGKRCKGKGPTAMRTKHRKK